MAKKSKLPLIYLIGVALVIVGFCLPVFRNGTVQKIASAFGGNSGVNGFKFISSENFNFVNLGAILIIAGAIAGAVLSFVSVKNSDMLKLVCIVVSIVGGVILFVGCTQDAAYKFIAKGFLKNAFVGFYMILAGWVVGLVGAVTKQ